MRSNSVRRTIAERSPLEAIVRRSLGAAAESLNDEFMP